MKYLRLLREIWVRLTMRLDGFVLEVKTLHTKALHWRCMHCDNKWGQSFENEYLCGACSKTQTLAFAQPTRSFGIVIGITTMETKKRIHFDSCNQAVEIPITLKNMERSGRLDTPMKRGWAKGILEQSQNHVAIDYQVHGHPTYDDDFKHPKFENLND